MNKERKKSIALIAAAILFVVLGYVYFKRPLLTDKLSNVEKMTVGFRKTAKTPIEKELYPEEDYESIKAIYESLSEANVRYKVYWYKPERNSEPVFYVRIFYKDGHEDFINTTETGYMYRDTNYGNNHIGGKDEETYYIIEDLFNTVVRSPQLLKVGDE